MTISPLSYRAAGPADIGLLLKLMRRMQQDDPWSVPFREHKVRAILEELLRSPHAGRAFLIFEGERCVGYVVLSFDFSLEYGGQNAWIDELFVERDFRGRGIGSKTLEFAFQAARELGAKVLHLEVNRGNPALDLYRRHGFEEHDRYLMSKRLVD